MQRHLPYLKCCADRVAPDVSPDALLAGAMRPAITAATTVSNAASSPHATAGGRTRRVPRRTTERGCSCCRCCRRCRRRVRLLPPFACARRERARGAPLALVGGEPAARPVAAVAVAAVPSKGIVGQLCQRPQLARVKLEGHVADADEHLRGTR